MSFLRDRSAQESPGAINVVATRVAQALLVPLALIGLVSTHAAFARYDKGLDPQLNHLGLVLGAVAVIAGLAAVLSTSSRLRLVFRGALLTVAVTLIAGGLVWGLPAASHARAVAHRCACEGG